MYTFAFYTTFLYLFELIISTYANPLIGGNVQIANAHDFPFIASLQTRKPFNERGDTHFCTGSLITLKHVVTSEHCIRFYQYKDINVVVGIVDLASPALKYDVKWWITYDQWNKSPKGPDDFNDIVVIALSQTVSQNGVRPVDITQLNIQQLYQTKAVTAGWGTTNKNKPARRLRKAVVDILSPEDCNERLYLATNIIFETDLPNDFCTAATPPVFLVSGDSGGPILGFDNTLIGLNIGTCPLESDCLNELSDVTINGYKVNLHTSISHYTDFIKAVTGL